LVWCTKFSKVVCTRREDGMQNTDQFLKQLSSVPVLYA
jgi:hypothetical protein